MDHLITSLDDATATRILIAIARARLSTEVEELESVPDLRRALADTFRVTPAAGPVSEGDLARQALLLLAEDPFAREAISALAVSPPVERFIIAETALVVTAALLVLQTHVRFERDKEGRWSAKLEKKPTNDRLLKPLIEKLLALFGRT